MIVSSLVISCDIHFVLNRSGIWIHLIPVMTFLNFDKTWSCHWCARGDNSHPSNLPLTPCSLVAVPALLFFANTHSFSICESLIPLSMRGWAWQQTLFFLAVHLNDRPDPPYWICRRTRNHLCYSESWSNNIRNQENICTLCDRQFQFLGAWVISKWWLAFFTVFSESWRHVHCKD